MAGAQRRVSAQPMRGFVGHRGVETFIHIVTTGAGGAISSQEAVTNTQVTAAKVGGKAGRYKLTIPSTFRDLLWADTWIKSANADAAYAADNTKGLMSVWRVNGIDGSDASDGTILAQFVNGSAFADAEVPDNSILYFQLTVKIGV